MKYRLALLSAGHLVTDVNQGALPALLPFLISEYHLSYAAAGVIIFSTNIVSTIVQPLFGYLADRVSSPWLMPAGIVLAGVGMGATGVVSGYGWVLVCVMVSGIGVAAFHPQGALMVDRIPGERKASAMSLFALRHHRHRRRAGDHHARAVGVWAPGDPGAGDSRQHPGRRPRARTGGA